MLPLMGNDLIQRLSRFNNGNYCIIEKVEFLPGIIRVFIDGRGDNSLGPLEDPMTSSLGILTEDSLADGKNPINGKFSVSDESRQYLGYLDFALNNSSLNDQPFIGFQYADAGYSTAKLCHFNRELINRYHIKAP